MKTLLILLMALLSALLFGQNWQTINNVNHVYDIEKYSDSIFFSSWGGVVEIQGDSAVPLSQMQEQRKINTGDGLVSNDIRQLAKVDFYQSLWMGSSFSGISVLSEPGIQNVGTDLSPAEKRINRMIAVGSQIFVASDDGLTEYYYLSGVNFPLLLHRYDSVSTSGGLPNNTISDMLLAANDIFYLAYNGGISYVHLDSLQVSSAWHSLVDSSPIPSTNRYLISANGDKLSVVAGNSIYVGSIDPDASSWESISTVFGNVSRQISAMTLSSNDEIWLGYGTWDEDLMLYNTVDDTLLTRIDLVDDNIRHWMRERDSFGYRPVSRIKELDGKIYLATWGNGIARYEDGLWQYFDPDSIAFPRITMATADQNSALWFCGGHRADIPVRKGTMGVTMYKDGHWQSLQHHNSLLHSNNILAIEVDSRNRKWFGAWNTNTSVTGYLNGITIYDDAEEKWLYLNSLGMREWNEDAQNWGAVIEDSPQILTSTISGLHKDKHDNMLILCYDGGVSVINKHDEAIGSFEVPGSLRQLVSMAYHNGRQYFIATLRDVGLAIWNHDSIPETDGPHWLSQIPVELTRGEIHGVASVQTPYSGWQHFIASGEGLFMWDEYNWYRYDVYIKRQRFNFATNIWENDTLYFADEERYFGSIRTTPTSIYGDPFGRVWVGSISNGITMYDPARERFTNYYQGNAPLLSNQISNLGFDPLNGRLLIGTGDGLNTLRIGRTVKPETELRTLKAFPNPFKPDGNNSTQIVNLPVDSMPAGDNECHIYSASGQLVIKLDENPFARFEWDGRNRAGNLVSSGVYYFVISSKDGNIGRGKLAVIR